MCFIWTHLKYKERHLEGSELDLSLGFISTWSKWEGENEVEHGANTALVRAAFCAPGLKMCAFHNSTSLCLRASSTTFFLLQQNANIKYIIWLIRQEMKGVTWSRQLVMGWSQGVICNRGKQSGVSPVPSFPIGRAVRWVSAKVEIQFTQHVCTVTRVSVCVCSGNHVQYVYVCLALCVWGMHMDISSRDDPASLWTDWPARVFSSVRIEQIYCVETNE